MSLIGGKQTDTVIAWAIGLGVVVAAYTVYRAGKAATETAAEFWNALTFDASSLEVATLTPQAATGIEDMIAKGFMERLPDGSTRFTAAGEADLQRRKAEYLASKQDNNTDDEWY